jgi:TP901 family phage tail tape measure protein
MEVFKAFATLSLMDMISGPLGGIRGALAATDAATGGLGLRMGRLALAMAPVAIAAGVVLGGLGSCVATAAGFEQALSGVAARSRAGAEDLALLEKSARELGASTSFTAVQVVQAQDELVKKGFSVNEIVEAMPGLLSLAAATQSDLATASNVTTAALNAFGLAAEDAGKVADIMAAASTGSATDINGLAMALQNAGGVVSSLKGDFALLAALQGKLQDQGIGESVAATSIKIMFGRLSAPVGEAQKALEGLGVTTRDAQGNMLPFLDIMGQMEAKLSTMGTAEQAEYLKKIFGEEAMGSVMALFKSGTASVGEFAEALRNSGGAAAEMAERQLDNLAGDVTVLGSAWEGLSITIGKLFIPIVRKVTQAVTGVVTVLDKMAQHPVGEFLLKLLAAASATAIGITAFSGAMWGVSKIAPIISKSLAPVKAAILGLGWPILAVIAAIALLYAAYRNNFGGIADVIDRWYNNIRLVVRGVIAVFQNLTGATGEIRGELAKEIKAAGLEGFVTTVSRVVYRIRAFFKGIWDALDFSPAIAAITPAIQKLRNIFDTLSAVFARLFGAEVTSATDSFTSFGRVVGTIASFALEGFAVAINIAVSTISNIVNWIKLIVALFTGDWTGAVNAAKAIWDTFVSALMSIADLFKIGDWLRTAWNDALTYLDSISLYDCGARILETLKEGILSAASAVKDGVTGVFQSIRDLLPFSDAKEGPFSQLTLSGTKLMTTLAEGVQGGAGALKASFTGTLEGIGSSISNWWSGLWSDDAKKITPELPPPPVPEENPEKARERGESGAGMGNTYTFHITANLPNVKDGKDFMRSLNDLVADYGGGFEPA